MPAHCKAYPYTVIPEPLTVLTPCGISVDFYNKLYKSELAALLFQQLLLIMVLINAFLKEFCVILPAIPSIPTMLRSMMFCLKMIDIDKLQCSLAFENMFLQAVSFMNDTSCLISNMVV